MDYKTHKKVLRVKDLIIDIILFPIRCICTPLYKLYEKHKENKRYSYKQIYKKIRYFIDYWCESDYCFIFMTDIAYVDGYEFPHIKTPYSLHDDLNWGWNGEYKRVKRKIGHMYFRQQDLYLQVLKDVCVEMFGEPMTYEDKKKYIKSWNVTQFKDYEMYLYSNESQNIK